MTTVKRTEDCVCGQSFDNMDAFVEHVSDDHNAIDAVINAYRDTNGGKNP